MIVLMPKEDMHEGKHGNHPHHDGKVHPSHHHDPNDPERGSRHDPKHEKIDYHNSSCCTPSFQVGNIL